MNDERTEFDLLRSITVVRFPFGQRARVSEFEEKPKSGITKYRRPGPQHFCKKIDQIDVARQNGRMGIIYLIRNTINKKCYVGQTTRSISVRYKQHMSNGSTCTLLKRSIEKYGKDNFTCTVLLECDNKDLAEYEKKYIREYNAFVEDGGLNLTRGGEVGKEYSQELKEKLREKGAQAWKDGKHDDDKPISSKILEQRKINAKGSVIYRKDRKRYNVILPNSWFDSAGGRFIDSFDNKEDAQRFLDRCKHHVTNGGLIQRKTKKYKSVETMQKMSRVRNPKGSVFKQGNRYYARIPKWWSDTGKERPVGKGYDTREAAWDAIAKWKVDHNIQ